MYIFSADDYINGYMPALAMVSHDGHVFWPPIVRLRSTCKIDITYFPFDDQMCSMKLGSWAYDGLQVDIVKRDKPIDLENYVSNGEWELINVKVSHDIGWLVNQGQGLLTSTPVNIVINREYESHG